MSLVDVNADPVRRCLQACEENGLGPFMSQVAASDTPFALQGDWPSLDLICRNEVRGRPNRAGMRIAMHGEGTMALLFYRSSSSPGSGDRFGYGGLAVRTSRLRPGQTATWIEYLASGFDVRRVPRGLQPQFQFPVPD
ncbi:MAG: hypothetical protein ACE5IK_08565 [Acidobacteriota bacterium]